MAWEENSHICLHMQLIAILSRTGVSISSLTNSPFFLWIYPKENLSYGMPVYKFSHQLLAVLVHLAHTAVKWKTNFLTLRVCLVCGCTLTHCVWSVCRICGSCRQQSLWYPPNRPCETPRIVEQLGTHGQDDMIEFARFHKCLHIYNA